MKIDVKVDRDLQLIPNMAEITIAGRKVNVEFDQSSGFKIEGPRGLLPNFTDILKLIYPVSSILSVRGLNWFDRKAESKVGNGSIITSPHSVATRLTYECPVDRCAMVEILTAGVVRQEATVGALSYATAAWYFDPAKTAEKSILLALILDNTVGAKSEKAIGTTMMLFPGDKIIAKTEDSSGAGSVVWYDIAYKLTEFDL